MRKLSTKFVNWCADTSAAARIERTIAQGAIGVLAGGLTTGEWTGAVIVGVLVAVITPIQAAIGKANDRENS